jgi:hypothetical protein
VRRNELFSDLPEIVLERQSSLCEKGVNFFAFSRGYSGSRDALHSAKEESADARGVVNYAAVDDHFVVRVEKPQDSNRRFGFLVYLFGFSGSRPFAAMPKLRIVGRHKNLRVFDGKRPLDRSRILIDSQLGHMELKVPLEMLGRPDFILASVRVSGGSLPPDAAAFRKVCIKDRVPDGS